MGITLKAEVECDHHRCGAKESIQIRFTKGERYIPVLEEVLPDGWEERESFYDTKIRYLCPTHRDER